MYTSPCGTIDANALLTEDSLVRWRDSAQDVEVLATCRRSVTKRGRPSAPQHRLMMTSLQVLRMVEGASDSLAWDGAAMMRWPIQGVKNLVDVMERIKSNSPPTRITPPRSPAPRLHVATS